MWSSVALFASFLMGKDSHWPKNTYIYPLKFYFLMDRGGDQKPRNRETKVHHRRSCERENTTAIASGWLHPPLASSSSSSSSSSSFFSYFSIIIFKIGRSSNPHCNIWQTLYFGAIYYITVIYCIIMACVYCLLVHGNGDIVCFDGCIHVCYLLWWYYVLMYECTHMLGDCIRFSMFD
jgi:hypothetical protein